MKLPSSPALRRGSSLLRNNSFVRVFFWPTSVEEEFMLQCFVLFLFLFLFLFFFCLLLFFDVYGLCSSSRLLCSTFNVVWFVAYYKESCFVSSQKEKFAYEKEEEIYSSFCFLMLFKIIISCSKMHINFCTLSKYTNQNRFPLMGFLFNSHGRSTQENKRN